MVRSCVLGVFPHSPPPPFLAPLTRSRSTFRTACASSFIAGPSASVVFYAPSASRSKASRAAEPMVRAAIAPPSSSAASASTAKSKSKAKGKGEAKQRRVRPLPGKGLDLHTPASAPSHSLVEGGDGEGDVEGDGEEEGAGEAGETPVVTPEELEATKKARAARAAAHATASGAGSRDPHATGTTGTDKPRHAPFVLPDLTNFESDPMPELPQPVLPGLPSSPAAPGAPLEDARGGDKDRYAAGALSEAVAASGDASHLQAAAPTARPQFKMPDLSGIEHEGVEKEEAEAAALKAELEKHEAAAVAAQQQQQQQQEGQQEGEHHEGEAATSSKVASDAAAATDAAAAVAAADEVAAAAAIAEAAAARREAAPAPAPALTPAGRSVSEDEKDRVAAAVADTVAADASAAADDHHGDDSAAFIEVGEAIEDPAVTALPSPTLTTGVEAGATPADGSLPFTAPRHEDLIFFRRGALHSTTLISAGNVDLSNVAQALATLASSFYSGIQTTFVAKPGELLIL